MDPDGELFLALGTALGIGLLIGLERGWKEREFAEGRRIAGLRTFGLIGLLGGVTGLLARDLGALPIGLGLVAIAGLLACVYVVNFRRDEDVGITSLVAALLTFGFGAMAGTGHGTPAAAFAVITTLVLGFKPLLHGWLRALEADELKAALQLALISVVLLPVLPDRGYGPWGVLNPYQIWWMVVLIASISFVGYFAIRIAGPGRGIAFTGLFGGLASSTAVTLHLSRLGARRSTLTPAVATGILLACGTMFPRLLVVASVVEYRLFLPLLAPTAAMAAVIYGAALFQGRRSLGHAADGETRLGNPLELKAALLFGGLLATIMVLGEALERLAGAAGLMALAAASGVADVDAISLSLARMVRDRLALPVATLGIVIAAVVNTLFKIVLVTAVGGRALGLRVGIPLLAGCGATVVAMLLAPAAGDG